MRTSRACFKKRERLVARAFGTVRTPLSGSHSRHTRSDTLHPALFIETKLRSRSPVNRWFAKVESLAAAEGKTPVLCMALKNHEGFLVVCRPGDLAAVASWVKESGLEPEPDAGSTEPAGG